jgi:hypothetical protein
LNRKCDALNIDNFAEFRDLCKTIFSGKPTKITVYADMADIEKSLRQRTTQNGSDNEEEEEEDRFHGLSDLEFGIARFQGIIEHKYANDHDAGYTYVSQDGTSLPLTPFMMKVWARACVRLLFIYVDKC